MAQTKRKRRSKHRGTAAGTIETRGRTGRKPTPQEAKKATAAEKRAQRAARPPSWNASIIRAALAAVMLFVFTQLGVAGSKLTVASGVLLALLSMALYVPLGFYFDRWVYNRRLRNEAKSRGKA